VSGGITYAFILRAESLTYEYVVCRATDLCYKLLALSTPHAFLARRWCRFVETSVLFTPDIRFLSLSLRHELGKSFCDKSSSSNVHVTDSIFTAHQGYQNHATSIQRSKEVIKAEPCVSQNRRHSQSGFNISLDNDDPRLSVQASVAIDILWILTADQAIVCKLRIWYSFSEDLVVHSIFSLVPFRIRVERICEIFHRL